LATSPYIANILDKQDLYIAKIIHRHGVFYMAIIIGMQGNLTIIIGRYGSPYIGIIIGRQGGLYISIS
jgi:hypothetical protein